MALMVRTNCCLNFFATFISTGIDIDWEYPNQRGGSPSDKENFVKLMKQLRSTLNYKTIITIAVAATKQAGLLSYNIPDLVKHINFVNLMTYGLHGSWDGRTGLILISVNNKCL